MFKERLTRREYSRALFAGSRLRGFIRACIGCSSGAGCFFGEAGCFGAANAAGVRRYAGVLREAVGLLGIGCC